MVVRCCLFVILSKPRHRPISTLTCVIHTCSSQPLHSIPRSCPAVASTQESKIHQAPLPLPLFLPLHDPKRQQESHARHDGGAHTTYAARHDLDVTGSSSAAFRIAPRPVEERDGQAAAAGRLVGAFAGDVAAGVGQPGRQGREVGRAPASARVVFWHQHRRPSVCVRLPSKQAGKRNKGGK